jgi:ElaB/YqjD/DUF883 family membrane-anchored ribosome-binding protein
MTTNDKRSGNRSSKTKRSASAEQLSSFIDDVEDLVSRVTHLPDAEIARIRERIESSVATARSVVESGARTLVDSTAGAAKATDEFVQRSPWKAIGAAALACLALGAVLRGR